MIHATEMPNLPAGIVVPVMVLEDGVTDASACLGLGLAANSGVEWRLSVVTVLYRA